MNSAAARAPLYIGLWRAALLFGMVMLVALGPDRSAAAQMTGEGWLLADDAARFITEAEASAEITEGKQEQRAEERGQ